jgi:hypothetical protein
MSMRVDEACEGKSKPTAPPARRGVVGNFLGTRTVDYS